MEINESTYEALNTILTANFQMNSFCDNIAQNLGAKKMVKTEPIFHEKFAHAFPGFADIISEAMLKFDARPVRKSLEENVNEYENNILIFEDLFDEVKKYRQQICKAIDIADFNNDVEIKITLEDFINKFSKYFNQTIIWKEKAKEYNEHIERFDHDFEDFTIL